VRRVEAMLPPGAMVFQLPQTGFPEEPAVGRMEPDDHLRLYLHSRSLHWSFGAMKGRYAAHWQASVAGLPPAEFARLLALAGFAGITVDRRGYNDDGAGLEAELGRLLGVRPVVSRDRRYAFLTLGPYAAELGKEISARELAARREEVLYPVTAVWSG